MSPVQKKITGFGLALLLALVTVFKGSLFTAVPGGDWLYMGVVSLAMPLLAWLFGGFFGKKARWAALAALLVMEVALAASLRAAAYGKQLPQPLARLMKYAYSYHFRVNVAFQPGKGRYDERLFYTLRPGSFEYSNLEFSTRYDVNSAGFRDDEESLRSPGIVFLGDSYGMGWGVEQRETYAELVGQRLGLRALNMGIASYGTARQWLALQSVPLDSCRLVVIQFCVNDEAENRAFVENGFRLRVSPPAVYEAGRRWNAISGAYFPFKHCHAVFAWAMRKVQKLTLGPPAKPGSDGVMPDQASPEGIADFFAILEKIREQYSGSIVVFNLGEGRTRPTVYGQLTAGLAATGLAGVHVFPAHQHVSASSYFRLDDHLNAAGHQQLADALAAFIKERGL